MKDKQGHILITGVTLAGNLGGVAMIEAIRQSAQSLDRQPHLASILPEADQASHLAMHYRIEDFSYRSLLLVYGPFFLMLLLIPMPRSWRGRLACLTKMGRTFYAASRVIDLSGISFVDGRGIPLLWYNVAVALPAFACGTPIVKMSQAVGPFSGLNRFVAKAVLSRVEWVYSRGHISENNMQDLGLTNSSYAPDVSFALDTSHQSHRAKKMLSEAERNVVLCPSKVVLASCRGSGVDFLKILLSYIAFLEDHGFKACLLPHSSDTGISKNDDLSLCQQLFIDHKKKRPSSNVAICDPEGDPCLAREIIANAEFALTCRFHSLISALATATPAITIGWSHKYAEAASPFGIEKFVIKYESLSAKMLASKTHELLADCESLRASMRTVAQKVSEESILAINVALKER